MGGYGLEFASGGLNVRLAHKGDIKILCSMYSEAIRKMRSEGIEQWDEIYPDRVTLLSDIEKQQMYLISENSKIVSAVVLNGEQPREYEEVKWVYHLKPIAVIHRLCVDAGSQGHRLGTETLFISEKLLINAGYRCVRLDVFPQNHAAVKMYESSGYKRSGIVHFRKGYFYCYEKLL